MAKETAPVKAAAAQPAAFVPRTEVSLLNKPFNWTVNGLRCVEKLKDDWKAGEWKQLAKDLAKFVIGVLSAIAITVLTAGVGALFLFREYSVQKQNDSYNAALNYASDAYEAIAQDEVNQAVAGKDQQIAVLTQHHQREVSHLNDQLTAARSEIQDNGVRLQENATAILQLKDDLEKANQNLAQTQTDLRQAATDRDAARVEVRQQEESRQSWQTHSERYAAALHRVAKHIGALTKIDETWQEFRLRLHTAKGGFKNPNQEATTTPGIMAEAILARLGTAATY